MNSPFFSVILPTYNRAYCLRETIKSVLEQDFEAFELIVINDGSTDNTLDIILEFKDHIKLINQENHGVSHARNRGIEIAKGNYIAFIDSDDHWHSDKLKRQYEYIQLHPRCVLLHSDEIWIRNGKRVNPKKIHQKGGGNQFLRSIDLCCISPSAAVVKKEVLAEFDGFDESYPVCEDYDLWLKITYKYSVDYIDQALITKHGGHADQLSHKYKAMDFWRVRSLLKFTQEELEPKVSEYLMNSLKKRVTILRNGYLKYNKTNELKNLEDLISEYQLEKTLP